MLPLLINSYWEIEMDKFVTKLCFVRKNKRLWIEGKRLTENGFSYGVPVTVRYSPEKKMITVSVDKEGKRKVAGRSDRKGASKEMIPIIDLASQKVNEVFKDVEVGTLIDVVITKGKIKFNI